MVGIVDSQSFSPNKHMGLIVWFDMADVGMIEESGNAVSQVDDKSHSGHNATQTNPIQKPTTNVNTINGKNVIIWEGNDALEIAASSSINNFWSGGGTVVFVSQGNSWGGNNAGRFFDKDSSGGSGWRINKMLLDEQLKLFVRFSTTEGVFLTPDNSFSLAPSIVIITYDSDNVANLPIFYLNGFVSSTLVETAPVGTYLNNTETLMVGNRETANRSIDGDFGEVILYDRILNMTEREQVQFYLSSKWGVPLVFTPTVIAGLQLWLDASDLSTITESGGAVDQWNDKSVNGNNATQTGTARPTTNSRTINGLNVLDFDGVDDLMILDSQPIVGTEARTIIIVALADDDGSDNYIISLSDNLVANGMAYRITAEIAVRIDGANRLFPAEAIEDGVNAAIITATNEANSNIELNASNFQIYKNSILLTGGSSASPGTLVSTSVGTAAIGDDALGTVNRLDGVIGEIIIYNRVISAFERQQVEEYLANKWSIPLAFPFVFSSDFSEDFS